MKKIIIIIVIAIAAVAAGMYLHRSKVNRKKGAVRYAAVAVERGPIRDTVETTGEVAPLNRVEVKPSVGGRVEKLLVDEGALVKKGQILGYLSSTDRVAILDAARSIGCLP